MPETMLHLLLRTLLFQLLRDIVGKTAAVGSEQFVYYNASDPQQCVAPDVFVKLGGDPTPFPIWKTWERGAPDLAIEMLSDSDADVWDKKVARYHAIGVSELVAFDVDAPPGMRLRVWDRVQDDLVEREIVDDSTPCATLGKYWVVRPAEDLPAALRLADDAAGKVLVLSDREARKAEKVGREAAEARVTELEAEIRKTRGR